MGAGGDLSLERGAKGRGRHVRSITNLALSEGSGGIDGGDAAPSTQKLGLPGGIRSEQDEKRVRWG